MKWKLPSDELLLKAVEKVLKSRGIVHGQEKLERLVARELAKVDKNYRVSGKRIRKLLASVDWARISVKFGNHELAVFCPICMSKLKPVYTKNLAGKRIMIGLKCERCNYVTRPGGGKPRLYIFSFKS